MGIFDYYPVCERCGNRSAVEAERRIFDYYPVMRRTESSDLYMTVAMRGSELNCLFELNGRFRGFAVSPL